MYTNPQQGAPAEQVQKLRQEAGRWLKEQREKAGLSQRDIGKLVGFEYYTIISQFEAGRGRIPPAHMRAYAAALGIPARDFGIKMMQYYDPLTYDLIYGADAAKAPEATTQDGDKLLDRIARLEALIANK